MPTKNKNEDATLTKALDDTPELMQRRVIKAIRLLGACSANTLLAAIPGATQPRLRVALSALVERGEITRSTYARQVRYGVREGKTAKEQAAAHARAMAQQAPRRSAAGLTPSRSYTNASVDGRRDPLTLEGSMVCVRAGGEDFLKHKSLGLRTNNPRTPL